MNTKHGAVACVIGAGLLAAGCAQRPARPGLINHVVLFKLHDPADAPDLIRDCDERLATIPGVTSVFCGTHFEAGRDTVETGYDVGFFVAFDSLEDYEGYVAHPDHVAVVREWRPRFEWIRVYDIGDETP